MSSRGRKLSALGLALALLPQRNRQVWVTRYSGPPDGPDCVPARTERIYDNTAKVEWTGNQC
jgi:hypothetical protein